MGTYAKAAEFVIEICRHFGWKQIGMLYHDNEGEGGSRSDCYFILEALFFALHKYTQGQEPWYTDFDQNTIKGPETYRDILRQAQLKTRSKVFLCQGFVSFSAFVLVLFSRVFCLISSVTNDGACNIL